MGKETSAINKHIGQDIEDDGRIEYVRIADPSINIDEFADFCIQHRQDILDCLQPPARAEIIVPGMEH